MKLRPMTADDWTIVRSIYEEGIATGQATFETQAPTWEQWDAAHHKFARIVLVVDDEIKGWAALSRVSARQVYCGVAEVSVYVSASSRGKGYGRQLLEGLISESERNGIWTLQAGIFPENVASIQLHQRCGFREVGRRERIAQLHGNWRDTVLMERRAG
ncbi:MAG TPA: GNAT family N-acetyltransferase [Pyrinomonadaceae bacterium]